MSDKPNNRRQEDLSLENVTEPAKAPVTPARRRLLKSGIGLAPIVLTLASRPVLAWHCKSPSAWGSEQLDPATSLRTNQGHNSYADETWTISNWKNNTSRAGLPLPWRTLGYSNGNWGNVKLMHLQSRGVVIPSGVDTSKKVVNFLGSGTEFQKTVVVAQLNALLLSSVQNCITLAELNKMASGMYSPPHVDVIWYKQDIVKYLQTNWIAVP